MQRRNRTTLPLLTVKTKLGRVGESVSVGEEQFCILPLKKSPQPFHFNSQLTELLDRY